MKRIGDKFQSSVYRKATNAGTCLDYDSFGPDTYKRSVIRSYLIRAYRISSNWHLFSQEVDKFTQILVNNHYPQELIDKMTQKFVKRMYETNNDNSNNSIDFFYKGQWGTNAKLEEKRLTAIIKNNVKPTNETNHVRVKCFYQMKRLKDEFKPSNGKVTTNEPHHVVYRYTCPHNECNGVAQYIGFTTNTVVDRCKQHESNGAIKQHLLTHSNISRGYQAIVKDTTIIARCHTQKDLEIAEALLIKHHQPSLNKQDQGLTRRLVLL